MPLAREAAQAHWDHLAYLTRLAAGEAALRRERSVQRRIQQASFPVIKTLEQFQWTWPKTINRLQVQNLFRLRARARARGQVFLFAFLELNSKAWQGHFASNLPVRSHVTPVMDRLRPMF